jgi:cell division protein FtsW (lipid II flippase)
MGLVLELLGMAVIAVLGALGARAGVAHALAKAAELGGTEVRTAAQVQAATLTATMYYLGGMGALIFGRLVSGRRGRVNIPAHGILPATVGAIAMGFALQMSYSDPLHRNLWPGPDFAHGVLLAGAIAAIVLLLPRDPVALAAPVYGVLPVLIVGVFIALWLFGRGTEEAQDTLINLAGFQPLELVKLAFVLFMGLFLGRRAAKLRYQRDRLFGLSFPRRRHILPAIGVFLALFLSFVAVNDLGPLLILSLVFLALFYLVTRAGGWVVAAVLVVALLVAVAVHVPAISGSQKVALRMQMWLDPWENAQPNGDQTALARWAIAAGYVKGRGLGYAPAYGLPAGHTDLVLAHLAEELGTMGMLLYVFCIGVIAWQGFLVALQGRTPERTVTAAGLATLLVAQWLVIFAGNTGMLPLTGVPVPFLSYGKTHMITFVLVAATLARLAEDGRAREVTGELQELTRGALPVLAAVLVAVVGGAAVAVAEGVVLAERTSLRGAITTLAPEPGYPAGRVTERYDPRFEEIARRIPRGPILDRDDRVIATADEAGNRTYPLGDAMGTLLGPPEQIILRPTWMLERLLAHKVRGYPEREDGNALWLAGVPEGGERLLFIVHSYEEKPEDRARAEAMAGGAEVRLLPLPAPDFRPLLPLLRAGPADREAALARIVADVGSRTARTTIDARLQKATSEILKRAAQRGLAAAAVVIDVNTGEVLARVQWPDFDPGDPKLLDRLRDPNFYSREPRFTGYYGAWPDKTGFRGVYQGGSGAKLFTSVAAARAGLLGGAASCPVKAGPSFACVSRDAEGPFFIRPGWYKAVHDHPLDSPHGHPDFIEGLAVSCNVYFGQLGLQLGPEAFSRLVDDGLEMGFGRGWYSPGKPGSRDLALTAFGQHASMMNVSQAARLVALIGGGGVYRRCPASLEKGVPCDEKALLAKPDLVTPILSGMRAVMTRGTGKGLYTSPGLPAGLRVYGKTGTADAIGIKEERPWHVELGVYGKPHSWFLALAEPAADPECTPLVKRRLGLALVIPRGGLGALNAGPAAAEVIGAMYKLELFGKPADLEKAAQEAAAAQPPDVAGAGVTGAPGASPAPGPASPAASPILPPPARPSPAASAGPMASPSGPPTPDAPASPQPDGTEP